MKKKILPLFIVLLSIFSYCNLFALEHGSISERNVQLSLNNEEKPGYTVDFKLVSVGEVTYAYIQGYGYTLAATPYASQVRYNGEKQCPESNRSGNTSIWNFATPTNQVYPIHIMQEEVNNFYVTPEFTYDKTIQNSKIADDVSAPVLSSVIIANITDNTLTIKMQGSDANDFFYYIESPDLEVISFIDTINITGLTPGTPYSFTVKAIDFSGNESTGITVDTETTGTRPEFNPDENLALNKRSSASNGSSIPAGNDGDYGSRWRGGANNNPAWWEVNLGAEYIINQVKIFLDPNDNAGGSAYQIQTRLSREEEWKTVANITDAVTKQNRIIDLSATPARFVRYYGTAIANWDHNFAEFEVYGTGYYEPIDNPVLTSVKFPAAKVIEGEETALSITPVDQGGVLYENASILSVEVLDISNLEVQIEKRDDTYYAKGNKEGTYILKVIVQDNNDTDVRIEQTTTFTVSEARRVTEMTISLVNQFTDFYHNTFATGNGIDLNIAAVDQYGDAITPEYTWQIEGTAGGQVENNKYIAANKGTVSIKAMFETTKGTVESNIIELNIITDSRNIALGKSVEAIEGSNNPQNVVDGNLGSDWSYPNQPEMNNVYDAWVIVDLGKEYNINLIEIYWEGACPADYQIAYSTTDSQDESFNEIYTVTGQSGMGNKWNNFSGEEGTARYVRMLSTKAATGYGLRLFEIRIYGTAILPELAVINFEPVEVIPGDEQLLVLSAVDQFGEVYTDFTITGIQISAGEPTGAEFIQKEGAWYVKGVTEGAYEMTATVKDDNDESITLQKMTALTVLEARHPHSINIETLYPLSVYPANREIDLKLTVIDQYNDVLEVDPSTIEWKIEEAAAGTVVNNKYTPVNKGTGIVKASIQSGEATVNSNELAFNVITDSNNIAKEKAVTAIEGSENPANAVDENIITSWTFPGEAGSTIYNAWISIDLEREYDIELIEIIWGENSSKEFTVDYSENGTNYTTKFNGSNSEESGIKINKFYLDAAKTRYIRINSTEAVYENGIKIMEVYVYGRYTGPELTTVEADNISIDIDEEAEVVVRFKDQQGNAYDNAEMTSVTAAPEQGLQIEKRENKWYVKGITVGTYTLTLTATDGFNTVEGTATATIKTPVSTDNYLSDKISVYPNPAVSEINITGDVYEAAIFSMQGQLIYRAQHINKIDVSTFVKGTYLLQVLTLDGQKETVKVNIQ